MSSSSDSDSEASPPRRPSGAAQVLDGSERQISGSDCSSEDEGVARVNETHASSLTAHVPSESHDCRTAREPRGHCYARLCMPLTKSKRRPALHRSSIPAVHTRLSSPSWTDGPSVLSAIEQQGSQDSHSGDPAEMVCAACMDKEQCLKKAYEKIDALKKANIRLQATLQSTKCVSPEVLAQRDDRIGKLEAELAEEATRFARLKKSHDMLHARMEKLKAVDAQRCAEVAAASCAVAGTVRAHEAAVAAADATVSALKDAERNRSTCEARCDALVAESLATCDSLLQTLLAV